MITIFTTSRARLRRAGSWARVGFRPTGPQHGGGRERRIGAGWRDGPCAPGATARRSLVLLLAAVAEERDGIAAEPPVDVEALAAAWKLEGTLIAVSRG